VVSALGVTPQQSTAIEPVYRTRLHAARRASAATIGTTEQVAARFRDGAYDDELLDVTSQLVSARREQCERRREMLTLSAAALSPDQREALLRMIQARRIMECGDPSRSRSGRGRDDDHRQ